MPNFATPSLRRLMQSRLAANLASTLGIKSAAERLERFSYMLGAAENQLLKINASVFTPKELSQLFAEPPSSLPTNFDVADTSLGSNLIENAMALDFTTSALDAILVKVNRAATYAGITNIEPVLNQELIEHCLRLPMQFKINQGNKKYLLKQIVHQYLPKEIMDRPKQGFGVPLIDWFKADLKPYLLNYLSEEKLNQVGLFNTHFVIKMRDSYLSGKEVNITKLWLLLVFMLWWEEWGS